MTPERIPYKLLKYKPTRKNQEDDQINAGKISSKLHSS
jgi:hypothetical protein